MYIPINKESQIFIALTMHMKEQLRRVFPHCSSLFRQVQNISAGKASQVCSKKEVEKGERWYPEIFGTNNPNALLSLS